MTDEERKRQALCEAACEYADWYLRCETDGLSPFQAELLDTARAWVKAEEAERLKPSPVHLLVRLAALEQTACGRVSPGGRTASTYHEHVTCRQCRRTVAYYRAGGKREAKP